MSHLDNLMKEIMQQATKEAEELLEKAKLESLKASEIEEAKAEKRSKEILQKAEIEGIAQKEKIISNAKLKARDMVLFAKQEIVSNVLNRVLEKLKHFDEKQYLCFVESRIKQVKEPDDTIEVLLTKEMKQKIGNKVFGYQVSEETVASGCSIKVGELFYNNEFTTLLDFYKEDLEKEILEKIFV
ncbi:MAG TPA: V-type ATP synthase subunit E [Fusobacterium sp.]|uniref:V-type ATP synthase subunit E n=1 Tax=Fusobacterium sp. TaxID=68766 RepID=UPI002F3E5042